MFVLLLIEIIVSLVFCLFAGAGHRQHFFFAERLIIKRVRIHCLALSISIKCVPITAKFACRQSTIGTSSDTASKSAIERCWFLTICVPVGQPWSWPTRVGCPTPEPKTHPGACGEANHLRGTNRHCAISTCNTWSAPSNRRKTHRHLRQRWQTNLRTIWLLQGIARPWKTRLIRIRIRTPDTHYWKASVRRALDP